MPWLIRTGVQVPVIFRKMINIMEYETGPIEILEGLLEANIDQSSSVEWVAVCLVNNVNSVVNILPGKEGVKVSQEHRELVSPVSARHNDCHMVWVRTIRRKILSTG